MGSWRHGAGAGAGAGDAERLKAAPCGGGARESRPWHWPCAPAGHVPRRRAWRRWRSRCAADGRTRAAGSSGGCSISDSTAAGCSWQRRPVDSGERPTVASESRAAGTVAFLQTHTHSWVAIGPASRLAGGAARRRAVTQWPPALRSLHAASHVSTAAAAAVPRELPSGRASVAASSPPPPPPSRQPEPAGQAPPQPAGILGAPPASKFYIKLSNWVGSGPITRQSQ